MLFNSDQLYKSITIYYHQVTTQQIKIGNYALSPNSTVLNDKLQKFDREWGNGNKRAEGTLIMPRKKGKGFDEINTGTFLCTRCTMHHAS